MNTNTVTDLLKNKLELLEEMHSIMKCQYENMTSDNLDMLDENINKGQHVMLKIDKIDSELAEYLDFEIQKENNYIILMIKDVLINIQIQDSINLFEGKEKCHKYSDVLKNVNIQKNVMVYEKMFQENSSYFIDNKE